MITVWSRKLALQRSIKMASLVRLVRTSSVVPTSTTRKAMRSGVTATMLTILAAGVTGVMSP
jgi:hypothetical protein